MQDWCTRDTKGRIYRKLKSVHVSLLVCLTQGTNLSTEKEHLHKKQVPYSAILAFSCTGTNMNHCSDDEIDCPFFIDCPFRIYETNSTELKEVLGKLRKWHLNREKFLQVRRCTNFRQILADHKKLTLSYRDVNVWQSRSCESEVSWHSWNTLIIGVTFETAITEI